MSKIISIHSFRRGTGRSTMVANLSAIIARYGYRVGIVDAHIQFPGIHVLFDFNECQRDRFLNDYLWHRACIQDVVYDVTEVLGKTQLTGGKLYLVPANPSFQEMIRVSEEGFNMEWLIQGCHELIDRLNLDYLFLDSHSGIEEKTLLLLSISDILLLMMRPDRQDWMGTAITTDIIAQLKIPQTLLIVNMVSETLDFEDLRQKIANCYSLDVVGILPFSEDVLKLISGSIFYLNYPAHIISKELEIIANKIISQ